MDMNKVVGNTLYDFKRNGEMGTKCIIYFRVVST